MHHLHRWEYRKELFLCLFFSICAPSWPQILITNTLLTHNYTATTFLFGPSNHLTNAELHHFYGYFAIFPTH